MSTTPKKLRPRKEPKKSGVFPAEPTITEGATALDTTSPHDGEWDVESAIVEKQAVSDPESDDQETFGIGTSITTY